MSVIPRFPELLTMVTGDDDDGLIEQTFIFNIL